MAWVGRIFNLYDKWTLGRVQAILTQMAKPASNGESGKKWQRVRKI